MDKIRVYTVENPSLEECMQRDERVDPESRFDKQFTKAKREIVLKDPLLGIGQELPLIYTDEEKKKQVIFTFEDNRIIRLDTNVCINEPIGLPTDYFNISYNLTTDRFNVLVERDENDYWLIYHTTELFDEGKDVTVVDMSNYTPDKGQEKFTAYLGERTKVLKNYELSIEEFGTIGEFYLFQRRNAIDVIRATTQDTIDAINGNNRFNLERNDLKDDLILKVSKKAYLRTKEANASLGELVLGHIARRDFLEEYDRLRDARG